MPYRLLYPLLICIVGWSAGAAAEPPSAAEKAISRGIDEFENQNYDKAIADFSEAIRQNPSAAAAYYNRGCVWLKKQDQDKALSDFSKAIELDPSYVKAYVNRSGVWLKMHEFDKALADCNEAIRLDPKKEAALFNRGAAWQGKRAFTKSIESFTQALELNPQNAETLNNIAWLRATCIDAHCRDAKSAIEYAKKACELTNWQDHSKLDTLAAAYAEGQDFQQALQYEQKALLIAPDSIKADYRHRLADFKSGHPFHHQIAERKQQPIADSRPKQPQGAKNRLHLLAVGINAYPGSMKLEVAVADAKGIDEAFRTHAKGLYDVHTRLLTDGQATRRSTLQALDDLAKKVKPGDIAVVYYAGHGDCKLAGQFYLVPIDAKVNHLAQTGISGDELRRHLINMPCTVLLIMDCCYAGSIDAGKKNRAVPAGANSLINTLANDDHGIVVMCGASKDQESGEETRLGHGYFTKALMEGLAGKNGARSSVDGLVYLSGLQNSVEDRVRQLSKGNQFPVLGKPTVVRSFPLSKPQALP